jgi:hypothetical protein
MVQSVLEAGIARHGGCFGVGGLGIGLFGDIYIIMALIAI